MRGLSSSKRAIGTFSSILAIFGIFGDHFVILVRIQLPCNDKIVNRFICRTIQTSKTGGQM